LNYISTLFPYWEKHKIHFQTRRSLEFGWWEFVPKKETFYQRIDHISRILNVSKLCWYLISLLRKTQNTFLEPAVKFFGWWESFPKKETHHQNMDYISRTLNLFELHQYLISLLRKMSCSVCLRLSSDILPYLDTPHRFYSYLFWFWWDHFATCDSKFGSIQMLGTQLCHILASNVNKYKYQVSGGMTDAILGNHIWHIQKWQYLS